MEDGVTPNSRPVRFGFDQREFPDFSWRGYAVMSPAQVRTDGVPSVPPAHPEGRCSLLLPFSVCPRCDWLALTFTLKFLLQTQTPPEGGMWTVLEITLSLSSRR